MIHPDSMAELKSEEIEVSFTECKPNKVYYKYLEWPSTAEMINIIPLEYPKDFAVFSVEIDKVCFKTLRICYKPVLPDTRNFEYFLITADGERKLLKLKGCTLGVHVTSCSTNVYLFSEDGRSVQRSIELSNESLVDTLFQFDHTNGNSLFTFSPNQGCLKMNESVKITVSFCPKVPGFIFRKFICLIRWQEPIVFTIYGNCKKYSMVQEFTDYIYTHDALPKYCNSFEEYIQDVALKLYPESKPLMSFSKKYFDLGFVDIFKGIRNAAQDFTLTNHGLISYLISWSTGGKHFRVEPPRVEIKSTETQMFTLIFEPLEPNQMYGEQLIADARWGENAEFILPFPLSINAIGQTLLNGRTSWDPVFKLENTLAVLPATVPSLPTSGTFTIFNKMKCPMMFQFKPPDKTLFTVKPLQGIINDDFQIFIIRLFPDVIAQKIYSEEWELEINAHVTVSVKICASAELPYLEFGENRLLKFPPTNLHTEKCLPVFVKNHTRLEIKFSVRCAELDSPFRCERDENIVGPREQVLVNMYFTPHSLGDVEHSFYLESKVFKPHVPSIYSKSIIVMAGQCREMSLVAKEKIINLGNVLLLNWAYGSFILQNESECEAFVRIDCVLSSERIQKTFSYKIYPDSIILQANSSKQINFGVRFDEDGPKQVLVVYNLYLNGMFLKRIDEDQEPKILSKITLFCSFPSLQVVDIRLNNFGKHFSKSHVWQMLEINRLNNFLQKFTCDNNCLNMKFPSLEENSREMFVELLIKNSSSHKVKLNIAPEKICQCKYKVEDTGISTRILHKHCIHDSQLAFVIRKSIFETKEEGTIEIHCHYSSCDRHLFKFLLSISSTDDSSINGTLNIFVERHCFKRNSGWLDFFTCTLNNTVYINLESVFVGDLYKPIQIIWVYNNSGEDVRYKIKPLNKNKYREIIFRFLNSTGTVASQEVHPIMVEFKPYQFITYTEEVSVVTPQRTFRLTVHGEGKPHPCYDTHSMLNKVCPTSLFDNWEGVQTSFDIIAITPILLHSTVMRIVFLKNNTSDYVKFYWVKMRFGALLDIKVTPVTGILEPNKIIACKILVKTLCSSARFHANITCKFTNIQQREEYLAQSAKYRKEAQLFDSCFEITDEDGYKPLEPNVTSTVKPNIYFTNITICVHTLNENQLDMVLPRLDSQILSLNQSETLKIPKNLKLTFEEGNVIVDVFSKVVWEVLHKQLFLHNISQANNNHYYKNILKAEQQEPKRWPTNNLFVNIVNEISCNIFSDMLGLDSRWDEGIYNKTLDTFPKKQELRKMSNKYYSDILDQGVYQVTSLYSDRNVYPPRRKSDTSKGNPQVSYHDS